jgi:hypothetical protein
MTVVSSTAKKLFQFLNEIGARVLGRHLGRVLEMAEDAATKWEYEAKIANALALNSNWNCRFRHRQPPDKRAPTEAAYALCCSCSPRTARAPSIA